MRSRNVATPGLVCIMIDDNKLSCLLIYRGHDLLFLYLSTVCPKCYSEGKKCCVFHLSSFFTFFYFTNTHSLSTVSILILFLFRSNQPKNCQTQEKTLSLWVFLSGRNQRANQATTFWFMGSIGTKDWIFFVFLNLFVFLGLILPWLTIVLPLQHKSFNFFASSAFVLCYDDFSQDKRLNFFVFLSLPRCKVVTESNKEDNK